MEFVRLGMGHFEKVYFGEGIVEIVFAFTCNNSGGLMGGIYVVNKQKQAEIKRIGFQANARAGVVGRGVEVSVPNLSR
jgi:hypothetical protein